MSSTGHKPGPWRTLGAAAMAAFCGSLFVMVWSALGPGLPYPGGVAVVLLVLLAGTLLGLVPALLVAAPMALALRRFGRLPGGLPLWLLLGALAGAAVPLTVVLLLAGPADALRFAPVPMYAVAGAIGALIIATRLDPR